MFQPFIEFNKITGGICMTVLLGIIGLIGGAFIGTLIGGIAPLIGVVIGSIVGVRIGNMIFGQSPLLATLLFDDLKGNTSPGKGLIAAIYGVKGRVE
jgi:hypothetical protein